MTPLEKQAVLGALFLPFLVQTALVAVERELAFMGGSWLVGGLIPTIIGFVFLERGLRFDAALVAVVYVPLMLGAMFLWGFGVVGMVYGDAL